MPWPATAGWFVHECIKASPHIHILDPDIIVIDDDVDIQVQDPITRRSIEGPGWCRRSAKRELDEPDDLDDEKDSPQSDGDYQEGSSVAVDTESTSESASMERYTEPVWNRLRKARSPTRGKSYLGSASEHRKNSHAAGNSTEPDKQFAKPPKIARPSPEQVNALKKAKEITALRRPPLLHVPVHVNKVNWGQSWAAPTQDFGPDSEWPYQGKIVFDPLKRSYNATRFVDYLKDSGLPQQYKDVLKKYLRNRNSMIEGTTVDM
ncbi:hypothetical protein SLS60_000911 [Paraconiothyrium brasiliense]|uniref:Uncharacterized protein n=1 Tax=Paraconiothyrium brasiliense TaxID=300254 RepID=A0ABR3S7T0_9PLEO